MISGEVLQHEGMNFSGRFLKFLWYLSRGFSSVKTFFPGNKVHFLLYYDKLTICTAGGVSIIILYVCLKWVRLWAKQPQLLFASFVVCSDSSSIKKYVGKAVMKNSSEA